MGVICHDAAHLSPMYHSRAHTIIALCAAATMFAAPAFAQILSVSGGTDAAVMDNTAQPPRDAGTEPNNPWANRPVCASMFLTSDWQLTEKQRACNWIQNGVLSTNALLGAVWSAEFSKLRDAPSERGDGFPLRFGRKFTQSAIKATGSYLGSVISREDPRRLPPFLALRTTIPPHGFFERTAHALTSNVIGYECVDPCTLETDIKKRFVLSAVLGSIASGVAGSVLTTDRPDAKDRALRGAMSAYAATFANAVFVEFKPELSAFGGRVFRMFGGR